MSKSPLLATANDAGYTLVMPKMSIGAKTEEAVAAVMRPE
jgi:hypothetical protein